MSSQQQARNALGAAVKARRKDLDMTQPELAEKINAHLNTISRLEQGHRVQSSTYEAVEEALRWPLGTISRALAGDSSVLTGTTPESVRTEIHATVTLPPDLVAMLDNRAETLIRSSMVEAGLNAAHLLATARRHWEHDLEDQDQTT